MTVRIGVVPVTAFMQNCRIIAPEGGSGAIVCDPGGKAREIACMLEDADLSLKGILLTHAHLDHIGAAADLAEICKAPIYGPCAADQALLDAIPEQASGLGLMECRPFSTRFVKDNEILRIGDLPAIEAIATPGHTPGGVCYYCRDEGFVLTGDDLPDGIAWPLAR
ncbi:MAG: MBL fold metallo-hydrolase, partial [Succinivibrio sp.]